MKDMRGYEGKGGERGKGGKGRRKGKEERGGRGEEVSTCDKLMIFAFSS